MAAPRITVVAAVARNGVIGKDNRLVWHLPEDMKHFRRLTMGAPVIMGRKTWDSLPERFRPLPGRINIVITRQPDWDQDGVQRASSLREALQFCASSETVWVMGGAQIYAQALPLAQRIEVTEIAQNVDGDAYAPVLGPEWTEAAREDHTSASGVPFSFVRYVRAA